MTTTRSRTLALVSRAVPGVGRVQAQAEPFAQAWREANIAALRPDGPLWVALGDSMSQRLGAHDITGGWVGQLHTTMQLRTALPVIRLVNLSATGATISDVLEDQIPRMRALGAAPALVTILIGANDLVRRSRRAAAVTNFARMLAALPDDVTVVATLQQEKDDWLRQHLGLTIDVVRHPG